MRNQTKKVVDADKLAETTPLLTGSRDGGGGSSLSGDLVTEASYLPTPTVEYVASPFGQRYLKSKPRGMAAYDVDVRSQVWMFDAKGYFDYGTFTGTDVPDQLGLHTILQDWYTLVRDLGKRSLKYKHTPLTLTDDEMLRHYLNAYHFVIANLITLLNLNRMGMYNFGFATLCADLPRYISRVMRLYRRASALPAPNLFKAHAIRSGLIVTGPNKHEAVFRFWHPSPLLAAASGGPTCADIAATPMHILMTVAELETHVSNLEQVERWLEIGKTAISADFTAVKDIIDMTFDVVPGSFVTGLPDSRNLPGIVIDPSISTDLLCRNTLYKDDIPAGTDQWIQLFAALPASYGDRLPIIGFGDPSHSYNHLLFGASKGGYFESDSGLYESDVNVDFRLFGTDVQVQCKMDLRTTLTLASAFGHIAGGGTNDDGCLIHGTPGTEQSGHRMWDHDVATSWCAHLYSNGLGPQHMLARLLAAARSGSAVVDITHPRILDEADVDFWFLSDMNDICQNTSQLVAQALGVPYLRSS